MTARLQLVIKDIEHTDHIAAYVKDRFERLRRIQPDIIRCRVVLSQPHRSKRTGNDFRAGVTLSIPGSALLAQSHEDPDLYAAVADGFHAVERHLRTRLARRAARPPLSNLTLSSDTRLGYSMAGDKDKSDRHDAVRKWSSAPAP